MIERPIPFNAFSVKAIIDDRKTQTRRVIVPRHDGVIGGAAAEPGHAIEAYGGGAWNKPSMIECIESPYGLAGDRLWVRETLVRCQDSEATKPLALYEARRDPVYRNGQL